MLKLIFVIDGLGTSREIALRWLSLKVTEDKSTLVQVKAWCRQAKAIIGANANSDLRRHMASLGHNELNTFVLLIAITQPLMDGDDNSIHDETKIWSNVDLIFHAMWRHDAT